LRWLAVFFVSTVAVAGGVLSVLATAGQDWAVSTLTVLGGAMTLVGLAWGVRALAREYRDLVKDLDQIAKLTTRTDLTRDKQAELREAVRPPSSSYVDVLYLKEWIRRLILEHTFQSVKYPAALTAVGIICSTLAGVWSVWTT
jgi:hypothetical protein